MDWGRPIPVDIFVMAKGEPDCRHVTKIGGLPYRPAQAQWPAAANGDPMVFLGQFCFADSRDITGPVPDDVLLVFAEDEDDLPQAAVFEWYPLGLSDLATPVEIPRSRWWIPPCYGHVYRTVNYPEAKRKARFKDDRYLTFDGCEVWSEYWLPQYQATQIGEAPFFIQGKPELRGKPLCCISSIMMDPCSNYSWVNQSERDLDPGSPDILSFKQDYLGFGDAGCLYVFIDETNRLSCATDCF